jgi:hypothetical protein
VEIFDPGINYLQGEVMAVSATGVGFQGITSVNQRGAIRQFVFNVFPLPLDFLQSSQFDISYPQKHFYFRP